MAILEHLAEHAAEAIVERCLGMEKIENALQSAEITRAVMEKAEEARAWWIAYWEAFDHPYARTHTLRSGYVENPGDYSKSIKIKYSRTSEGYTKARITAHDYKSHWIEYGSSHMPTFAPMAATRNHYGGNGSTFITT